MVGRGWTGNLIVDKENEVIVFLDRANREKFRLYVDGEVMRDHKLSYDDLEKIIVSDNPVVISGPFTTIFLSIDSVIRSSKFYPEGDYIVKGGIYCPHEVIHNIANGLNNLIHEINLRISIEKIH